MAGFRLHQLLAVLVLLAAAAWVLTGKFSHIGSESAGAEEAAPERSRDGAPRCARCWWRSRMSVRYSRAIRVSGRTEPDKTSVLAARDERHDPHPAGGRRPVRLRRNRAAQPRGAGEARCGRYRQGAAGPAPGAIDGGGIAARARRGRQDRRRHRAGRAGRRRGAAPRGAVCGRAARRGRPLLRVDRPCRGRARQLGAGGHAGRDHPGAEPDRGPRRGQRARPRRRAHRDGRRRSTWRTASRSRAGSATCAGRPRSRPAPFRSRWRSPIAAATCRPG